MDEIEEYPSSQDSREGPCSLAPVNMEIEEYPSFSEKYDDKNSVPFVKLKQADIEIGDFSDSSSCESREGSSPGFRIQEFPEEVEPEKAISKRRSTKTGSSSAEPLLPRLPGLNSSSQQERRKVRLKKGGLADETRRIQRAQYSCTVLWQQKVGEKRSPAFLNLKLFQWEGEEKEVLKVEIVEVEEDFGLVKLFSTVTCQDGGWRSEGRGGHVILDGKWCEERNKSILKPGRHLLIHHPYRHFEIPELNASFVILCPQFVQIMSASG